MFVARMTILLSFTEESVSFIEDKMALLSWAALPQKSLDSALPAVVRHGSALPCANDN